MVVIRSATRDAVVRGGEPDPVQLTQHLGEHVGPGERGPLARRPRPAPRGRVAEHPVLQVRRRAAAGRSCGPPAGHPRLRVVADVRRRRGPATRRPGRPAGAACLSGRVCQGGLLPQLDHLPGGRLPPVRRRRTASTRSSLAALDRGRALRELLPQRRRRPRSTSHFGTADRRRCSGVQPQPRSAVSRSARSPVVQLRQADRGPEQRLASPGCATARRRRPAPG